jgi:hypothetical protein
MVFFLPLECFNVFDTAKTFMPVTMHAFIFYNCDVKILNAKLLDLEILFYIIKVCLLASKLNESCIINLVWFCFNVLIQ